MREFYFIQWTDNLVPETYCSSRLLSVLNEVGLVSIQLYVTFAWRFASFRPCAGEIVFVKFLSRRCRSFSGAPRAAYDVYGGGDIPFHIPPLWHEARLLHIINKYSASHIRRETGTGKWIGIFGCCCLIIYLARLTSTHTHTTHAYTWWDRQEIETISGGKP